MPWARSPRARAAAAVQRQFARFDDHDRDPQEGLRRPQGRGRGPADRQPRRTATASDLIWRETVRGKLEAAGGQHGQRGRQRRLLHRHGRQEDLCRAGHDHRLDRRGRRQAGDRRPVREARPEHRDHQPRQEQRGVVVHAAFLARRAQGLDAVAPGDLPRVREQGRRGPKMEYDRLESLAQGRVYTGRQAKKLGLIDEIGTLDDAIGRGQEVGRPEARRRRRHRDPAAAQIVLRATFQRRGREANEFTAAMPEVVKTIRQAALWRQLLGEKVLLWMPYHIELK